MPTWSGPMALLATATLLLSGCSGPGGEPTPAPATPAPSGLMTIVGLVQNATFSPVAGAQVSLRLTEFAATTDAGGLFTFTGLPLSPYLVDVVAEGFENATLNAEPQANVSLSFILAVPASAIPAPVTVHFTGKFDCAFEALIISPSCDTLIDETGQSVFEDISTFNAGLSPRWATAVVDVDFEPQPGLDGLRVTLQAKNDADKLAEYEVYGRFHGAEPFSFRIEPGQEYPEGTKPVPADATSLQLEVYPQGHGWHAGGVSPFLGVGAAQNVVFDVYVTVFYVEPAPSGFSLLA